jgi:hypothetical protein
MRPAGGQKCDISRAGFSRRPARSPHRLCQERRSSSKADPGTKKNIPANPSDPLAYWQPDDSVGLLDERGRLERWWAMGATAGAKLHGQPWRSIEPGFAVLFGAACLVLLVDELIAWSGGWSLAALGLGLVCAMLGVGVFPQVERARSRGMTLAYFAVQLPLGVATFLLFSHACGM